MRRYGLVLVLGLLPAAFANNTPEAISVLPASGSGLTPQIFSFAFSDLDGPADLRVLTFWSTTV